MSAGNLSAPIQALTFWNIAMCPASPACAHIVLSTCLQQEAFQGLQADIEAQMQATGFTSGGPVSSSALLVPALAPPSPQALSGMNPSQLILSQPSGATHQALQLPSQPDVQSALSGDASDGGVRKPQVDGALSLECAAALGMRGARTWPSHSMPGMQLVQAASDAEHPLNKAIASVMNKSGDMHRQSADSISMRGR